MLRSVDRQRLGVAAQNLYSQRDDLRWFISVTDELYRGAVRSELSRLGDGHLCIECRNAPPACRKEFRAECALQQVYTCRAEADIDGDTSFADFLQSLVHVRHDKAFPCPVTIGSDVPGDLELFPLDVEAGATTSLNRLVHGAGMPVVLITGSWS